MDLSSSRPEPNPWTLPALALGAAPLVIGVLWSWVFWAAALPAALLGLGFSFGGLRSARRIGSGQWAARLAVLLCSVASLAGLVSITVLVNRFGRM
ncbi:hypothetical protein [Kitasatospora sp. NPDC094015]|uniref:hypothetical protein n=1 Tax=Kitasatospora sp. NPDC094015 TaxID=3155205 RepID=UPI00331C93B9